jgi:5-formyltetrahydrofolate cyclo-ligase
MNKQELRLKYKKLRQDLNQNQLEDFSIQIANNVLKMDIWDNTYFHIFMPIQINNEVNTTYLLSVLQGKDKEIVVSKSNFETLEMQHYLLTDNTKFVQTKYGIIEPISGLEVPVEKLDVVFVPLLAYDYKGNRVGYGKGFYDKFLFNCKPDCIKIGISFFEPEIVIEDVSLADVCLNYCVNLDKTIKF